MNDTLTDRAKLLSVSVESLNGLEDFKSDTPVPLFGLNHAQQKVDGLARGGQRHLGDLVGLKFEAKGQLGLELNLNVASRRIQIGQVGRIQETLMQPLVIRKSLQKPKQRKMHKTNSLHHFFFDQLLETPNWFLQKQLRV